MDKKSFYTNDPLRSDTTLRSIRIAEARFEELRQLNDDDLKIELENYTIADSFGCYINEWPAKTHRKFWNKNHPNNKISLEKAQYIKDNFSYWAGNSIYSGLSRRIPTSS